MTNKTNKKAKKPLRTTLGKANQYEKEEIDLSHVRRPIDTSIFGLRQVLSLFQTATEEVKNYITYECDVMYECRICKTIYRSLANFILHKRNYCRDKFMPPAPVDSNCDMQDSAHPPEPPEESNTVESRDVITPEPIREFGKQSASKSLSPVIQKLKVKQEINQLAKEILTRDLSNEMPNEVASHQVHNNDFLLEEIATNNAAVFQTLLQNIPTQKSEFMKSEVMEIHGILDSDEAVIGSDGKICNFQTDKVNSNPVIAKKELTCTECSMKFSTKKTLTFHLKHKHNDTRLVYVCPDCKETYANAWCVYRHLYKVHRKTSAQVKKLRNQVHNSVIRKDQEPRRKEEKNETEQPKTDEENQWLDNIEGDNDFQMCGGCGKRFERKAALHSHAQMCIKRIAVCNTIKENNAKKKGDEPKDIKVKNTKVDKPLSSCDAPLKGASKRKPCILRTYKTSEEKTYSLYTQKSCDVNANSEMIETICDDSPIDRVNDAALKSGPTKSNSHPIEDTKQFEDSENNPCSVSDKMLGVIGVNPSENTQIVKQETLFPPLESGAEDFDLFCDRVAERILQTGLPDNSEKDDNLQITPEENAPPVRGVQEKNNMDVKDEDDMLGNTSVEVQMSPCSISIRSLEDLIGFPKDQEDSLRDQEELDVVEMIREASPEVKTKSRASKSARSSPENHCKSSQRKRTASLDSRHSKVPKRSYVDSIFDITFTTKAAPYMDQRRLSCTACQLSYPTFSELMCHMSKHFSWYRFQCSRCSFNTFREADCADHAKRLHDAVPSEISSIVLPIPNWKTVLMSSEFQNLKNDNNKLSETDANQSQDKGRFDVNCGEGDSKPIIDDNIIDTLFVDSDISETSAMDNVFSFPQPILQDVDYIKHESIDIVDENTDSFQLEVPQEMYTREDFEVIHIDDSDDEDKYCFRTGYDINAEMADNDDFIVLNSFGIAELQEEVLEEPASIAAQGNVMSKVEDSKKDIDATVNLRPTRNRVRSIKTLQNDFLYDLGKVIKLNDAFANKPNGSQKQKKNGGGANSKKR